MKKIVSLFQRNYEGDYKVRNEVVPGSEWVINGEGVATRKWDGTAVLIKDGKGYRRYGAKCGKKIPPNFVPAQPEPDPKTGFWPGWVPADGRASIYIQEAIEKAVLEYPQGIPDGTYEACGPSIGGKHGINPENLTSHILVRHGEDLVFDCPRNFIDLMDYLRDKSIEGIVWHHPDGRMVKIKKSDFPY